ncbi:CYTH and CHAD domain-containing protein [Acinetobacter johnsonii]|uniref:CYTH and CHAD domain-containing protein n=1 Tax=Acinetobacter johnsonii TaxID=40214 RepID=UPI002168A720|nr:CHAD domain-containing protein [Acinetobacter johnsonii]MCS3527106.1 inorganic triphosphatase YgiF [Acinetobacter johnsonii]
MQEIEFKFQVPVKKRKALQKAFTLLKAEPIHLAAQYFDTADQTLAKHCIAIRRRQENDEWKQTFKAVDTAKVLSRLELEFDIAPPETAILDLDNYEAYPAAYKKLKRALGLPLPTLELLFETNIQRLCVLQNVRNSTVEIALDIGKIFKAQSSVDIFEIEFELKQGSIEDLITFIRPWVQKYQLTLDTHSKSDYGLQAVRQQSYFPAQYQTALVLNRSSSEAEALQSMVANCLQHLLPNTSSIARQQYSSEHVHQARVAIRRLRTALKSFAAWSEATQPHWKTELTTIFQALGGTRDIDALNEDLLPQLIEAGYPLEHLAPSTEAITDVCALFQRPETTQLWLELILFTEQELDSSSKTKLKKHALKVIQALHHKICAHAEHFSQLEDEEKHRIRKQVKQLRYSIEFVTSLLDVKALKTYLKKLKAVQESLGHYNDLVVADALFQQAPEPEAAYSFATGWIAAEKNRMLTLVEQQLMLFSQTKKLK